MDVVGAGNSAGFTNGASTTTQWNITDPNDSGASSTKGPLTASTVTNFSWTLGTADDWVDLAVEIKPSGGTSAPFQQQIIFNPSTYSAYEASNLGNIRFSADFAGATPLYAWLESCTPSCTPTATSATVWVKLTSTITGGGGTLIIYIEFYPLSTNFDGVYWGEAPGLSGSYGQYDNGANVFGNYWNFAGTSLPSGWSSSTTASVSNQLSISAGSVYTNSAVFASLNYEVEMYAKYTSLNSGGYSGLTQSNSQAPQGANTGSAAEILWQTNSGSNTINAWAADGTTASYNLQSGVSGFTPTLNTFYVLGSFVTSSQVAETRNYATLLSASGTYNTNQYIILGYFQGSGAGTTSINPITIQWTRTRALPPNNVMPSTSFGSLIVANPVPSVADTQGDPFTLGVSNTVVSSSYIYYSYIWYAAAGSSAPDTITATFPSAVTGSVSIYELKGATIESLATSTGSSSGGSTTLSVASFTPGAKSFVIGNAETSSSTSSFTAGSGFTLGGTCASVYGCGEYRTGVGSATTVPFTLGVSAPWVESAISFAPSTYYSYIWYATAVSSGADTITASFSSSVTGSVSVYEISGASTTSPSTSTGSSSTGSTAVSVTSFTPSANSFVIGNAETSSSTSSFTAGSGYTLSGTCASVYGCGEYQTGVSSATTVPFTLGVSAPWVESAISFTPGTAVYYSYIWYATAVSSGADTITASFSSSVTGSVSIYEISVNANPSIASSTGSSSGGSATPSVASFTPVPTSIVIGNLETNTPSSTFTAGSGYVSVLTGAGGCDPTNAAQGCSEYETGVSTSTTAPFTLGTSTPWVESAIAIGPNTYYSYIWYATAGSSGADTVTASFGSTVVGSVSVYENSGATTTGLLPSTGNSP